MEDLLNRATSKLYSSTIIYILAVLVIYLSLIILIPVIYSVNQQKDRVLTLFCEIDNGCIRILNNRCERFIQNINTEEGNEDIESAEDIENNLQQEDDDEYGMLAGTGKRLKRAKGKTKAN